MRYSRVALWVWYRGECFRGFQTQHEGPTVQDSLQRAIGVSSGLVAAGRSDKGVHARMQVICVRQRELPPEALVERLQALAPSGLGVCSARESPRSFHPHWSATGKEYRYRLRLGNGPSPWGPYSWSPSEDPRLTKPIDPDRLASLLGRCVGTHDFAAFHESSSPRRLRSITNACLVELGSGFFEARLLGDGFGRYQVRYLIGSAVAVCAGEIAEDEFRAALEQAAAIRGIKAPARGLILWEVSYPADRDPFSALERRNPERIPCDPPFASGREP